MFRIIVVEREYGSGAASIASQLAARLGWKLWDHAFTEELAKMAKASTPEVEQCCEKCDSALHRLVKVFMRGSYEHALPLGDYEPLDSDRLVETMRGLCERIASEGKAVIVGRGAAYFLRKRPDVFCTFLYAPRGHKIRRTVADGKSREEAERLVDTVDQERKDFVRHYFDMEWPTRSLYHMMLNTTIGEALVVDTVLQTMRQLEESAVHA